MIQKPEIKLDKGIPTLFVKGEPFFALSGEVHNSSSSNLEYMKNEVWPNLENMNLNSLIVPIYWELTEPEEGCFDFSIVEGLIHQARERNTHLILLWFGLWKNAESMYVPKWIKNDSEKYYKVQTVSGGKLNSISPLCEAAVEKDALAFSKLLKFVRQIDEKESTVIMVQVENEIGLLGTDRDYGNDAETLIKKQLPEVLTEKLGVQGTWETVFKDSAGEKFMAYYYARAIERIASQGKAEYDIPCFTNAWLKQYPWYPGSYPSGGPIREVHDIWKASAPSLFTLAPDIYVPCVADVMKEYSYSGNPLLIPEVRKDAITSSYCLYAFTKYNAICYSPFGIEDLALPPESIKRPPMEVMIALNIDPEAFNITNSKEYLAETYDLVNNLKPLLLEYRNTDKIHSFLKKSETDFGTLVKLSDYDAIVSYKPKMESKPTACGGIIELDNNKFLIFGMMCSFEFRVKSGEASMVDVLKLEEGKLIEGNWVTERILNGDEKMSINFDENIACIQLELYKY